MNTPAHVAASLLVWRNRPGWWSAAAVTVGAVLPDLPMFGFYAYQKMVGSSERQIWNKLYFSDDWQLLFDVFNSIPIAVALIVAFHLLGFRLGVLLAASALLHMICDLPVHNDDAHRHFLPFTNWRFESPLSYWDPRHFGAVFVWIELGFAILSSLYVGLRGESLPMRVVAWSTVAIYGPVIGLVVWVLLRMDDARSLVQGLEIGSARGGIRSLIKWNVPW